MTHDLQTAVREFLRTHPGVSKTQLRAGIAGGKASVDAAFGALLEAGEAIYVAPSRPGVPGRCALRNGNGTRQPSEAAPEGPHWRPAVSCPKCGLGPPTRFTGREVARAKLERQGAHLQNVQCGRCRTVYWIRADDVARATLDKATRAS